MMGEKKTMNLMWMLGRKTGMKGGEHFCAESVS